MVENQSRIKNPSCGIYLDWSYLETDMDGASCHSRGGLFVYQFKNQSSFMNKNLQSLIGVSVLIIAVSIAYYLFSYIPERNKLSTAMTLQKQCLDMGPKKVKEDSAYDYSPEGSSFSADFIFDKKTNECFYRTTFMASNGTMTRSITDLFTNRTIAEYMEDKNSRILAGDKGNYLLTERSHF